MFRLSTSIWKKELKMWQMFTFNMSTLTRPIKLLSEHVSSKCLCLNYGDLCGWIYCILISMDQYFCSSYLRNRHKRDRLIKVINALGQWQLCRDWQKCSTYPRYWDKRVRDNEVRLYMKLSKFLLMSLMIVYILEPHQWCNG